MDTSVLVAIGMVCSVSRVSGLGPGVRIHEKSSPSIHNGCGVTVRN